MERVENRMVKDSVWSNLETSSEVEKRLKGAGYSEIGTGNFVPEEDAFDYALERIAEGTEEEQREFVEWFYSSWVKEDGV